MKSQKHMVKLLSILSLTILSNILLCQYPFKGTFYPLNQNNDPVILLDSHIVYRGMLWNITSSIISNQEKLIEINCTDTTWYYDQNGRFKKRLHADKDKLTLKWQNNVLLINSYPYSMTKPSERKYREESFESDSINQTCTVIFIIQSFRPLDSIVIQKDQRLGIYHPQTVLHIPENGIIKVHQLLLNTSNISAYLKRHYENEDDVYKEDTTFFADFFVSPGKTTILSINADQVEYFGHMSNNNEQHRTFKFNDPINQMDQIIGNGIMDEPNIKDCLYEYDNLYQDTLLNKNYSESYKSYVWKSIPIKKFQFIQYLTQILNQKIQQKVIDSLRLRQSDYYKIYNNFSYQNEELWYRFKVIPEPDDISRDIYNNNSISSYFLNRKLKQTENNGGFVTNEVVLKKIRDGGFDYSIEDKPILEYLKEAENDSILKWGIDMYLGSILRINQILGKYKEYFLKDTSLANQIQKLPADRQIDFLLQQFPDIAASDRKIIETLKYAISGGSVPKEILAIIKQDSTLTPESFTSFENGLLPDELKHLKFYKLNYFLTIINKKYKEYVNTKIIKQEIINRNLEKFRKIIHDKKWQYTALSLFGIELGFYKNTTPEHKYHDIEGMMKEIIASDLPATSKIYINHYFKQYIDNERDLYLIWLENH
jgi:hypothetical protein